MKARNAAFLKDRRSGRSFSMDLLSPLSLMDRVGIELDRFGDADTRLASIQRRDCY